MVTAVIEDINNFTNLNDGKGFFPLTCIRSCFLDASDHVGYAPEVISEARGLLRANNFIT